jgi:hypothetical protein
LADLLRTAAMAELRVGERVTFHGRAYEISGFTPMSVKPRHAFLKDLESGDLVVANMDELAAEQLQRPPEQSSNETS